MAVCALASLGHYDEGLYSLIAWVVLQGSQQQQKLKPKGGQTDHNQQRFRGSQADLNHHHQKEQQQRPCMTDVAGTLWACARVGHGLHESSEVVRHAQQQSEQQQQEGELASSEEEQAEMGTQAVGVPCTEQHDSVTSNPLRWRMHSDLLDLLLLMQDGGSNAEASSTPAFDRQRETQPTQAARDVARSLCMSLFALAVLCPVLVEEQGRRLRGNSGDLPLDTHRSVL